MTKFPMDFSKLDLSSVMEMAQKVKEQMARLEESLSRIQVESVVGGGMVKVRANGKGELVALELDPELLAMNDKAMLEELIVSGVNQALAEAKRQKEEEMGRMTGGMILPGWFA